MVAQTACYTLTDPDGNLNVFNVDHDNDEQWLNTNWFNPENVWNPDNQFVFVRPRKSLYFSPLQMGEFSFIEFFNPASEHPANQIKLFG